MSTPRQRGVTPKVAVDHSNEAEHRRQIANATNAALAGKLNNTGEITLAAGTTTTTLTNARFMPTSVFIFSPKTPNAAAELPFLSWSVSANTLTITHRNLGTTDRTFGYAVFG